MGAAVTTETTTTYGGVNIIGDGNIAFAAYDSTINVTIPISLDMSRYRSRRSAGFGPPVHETFSVQTLQTCLVDYQSSVCALEDANAVLELKTRQWVETSGDSASRDYTTCFQTISAIRSKIQTAVQVYGPMDDAQTTDEPFNKSQKEALVSRSLKADSAQLKKILDQLTKSRSHVQTQIQGLEEELKILKKNNQEVTSPRSCVDTRLYDTIYTKNQKDLEAFLDKTQVLKNNVVVGIQTLQSSRSQVIQVQSTLQSLETQLQSTLDTEVLEGTLAETLSQYGGQLSEYLTQVTTLEEQLIQLRMDLDLQDYRYKKLLDTSVYLEWEVSQYKRLQG